MAQNGFRFAQSVEFTYYGAAANILVGRGLAESVGAGLSIINNPLDAVGNVIGLNTLNPFKFVGSVVVSPSLFLGPSISPHAYP